MTVRPAPRALTVIKDYDSGAQEAQWKESRRAMAGGTMSARCKRLEENMLLNLSTMQNHRRGLEAVVQSRADKAKEGARILREEMKAMRGGKTEGSGNSLLGIGNMNFQTMKDRAGALEESVGRNQGIMMGNRTMLDSISAAKAAKEAAEAAQMAGTSARTRDDSIEITQLPEEGDAQAPDRLDVIEANASKIREKTQEQDITKLKADAPDQFEIDLKIQTEERQYILFGIKGMKPSSAALLASSRPSSAPAGARSQRVGGVNAWARPPSAASSSMPNRPPSAASSMPARPASAMAGSPMNARPGSAASATRPFSARSGGVAGMPSRPCSANSMRARMKAMEENVARNKKILANNRDGLEVVKLRRQQAADAMAQLLIDMKPVPP